MGTDSIQIKISAIDDFSKVVNKFRNNITELLPQKLEKAFQGVTRQVQNVKQDMKTFDETTSEITNNIKKNQKDFLSFSSGVSGSLKKFSKSSLLEFGKLYQGIKKLYNKELKKGGNLDQIWASHWKSVVSMSLNAVSQIASGISSKLGNAFSEASKGFQIGSFFGNTGAIVGGVIGGLAAYFSGTTNEQLMAQYGAQAGNIYGKAWSAEVESVMKRMAEQLPKAGSGKNDYIAAMFHPETIKAAMENLRSFGQQVQDEYAHMFEDNVKPVLMNILKMSESEAAQAMAPLFEQAVNKALEFGEALSPYMQKMLDWAKSMGAEINISAEKFSEAMHKLMSKTNISTEQFKNLRDLALQVGVDIDKAFGEAMSKFIEDGDFAIEKLKGIALAAKDAGYDIEKSFSEAIRKSTEKIQDLRSQLQDMGRNALNWFLDKINMRQSRRNYQYNYVDKGAKKAQEDWEKNNKHRLKEIEKLSGAEREAAQKAYDTDKQKAHDEGKKKSQIRYNELLAKANAINIDGKHDLKDIREAIKDLPEEEQKIVLELAKQKQERIAHREEMKRQKKLAKQIKDQIKAQKDLIKSINSLAQSLSGSFGDMSKNLPDSSGFASDMQTAFNYWKYMAEHPLNAAVSASGSTGGISAAAGVDMTISGPVSGYQVPLTMHGTERLHITPMGGGTRGPAQTGQTVVNNFNLSMPVHSLDTQTTEQWMRNTALPMMARHIKTELTGFDRKIVKGDN